MSEAQKVDPHQQTARIIHDRRQRAAAVHRLIHNRTVVSASMTAPAHAASLDELLKARLKYTNVRYLTVALRGPTTPGPVPHAVSKSSSSSSAECDCIMDGGTTKQEAQQIYKTQVNCSHVPLMSRNTLRRMKKKKKRNKKTKRQSSTDLDAKRTLAHAGAARQEKSDSHPQQEQPPNQKRGLKRPRPATPAANSPKPIREGTFPPNERYVTPLVDPYTGEQIPDVLIDALGRVVFLRLPKVLTTEHKLSRKRLSRFFASSGALGFYPFWSKGCGLSGPLCPARARRQMFSKRRMGVLITWAGKQASGWFERLVLKAKSIMRDKHGGRKNKFKPKEIAPVPRGAVCVGLLSLYLWKFSVTSRMHHVLYGQTH